MAISLLIPISEEMRSFLSKLTFLPTSKLERILLVITLMGFALIVVILTRSPAIAGPRSKSIGTAHVSGTLTRRQTLDRGWREVGEGEPIYLQDLLYTPKGSSATIQFGENRKLEIMPETLVHLDELQTDRLAVSLYQGDVKGDSTAVLADTFSWALHQVTLLTPTVSPSKPKLARRSK